MPSILLFANSKRLILCCIIGSLIGCKADPNSAPTLKETVKSPKEIIQTSTTKVISPSSTVENPAISVADTKEVSKPNEMKEAIKPKVKADEAGADKDEVAASKPVKAPKKSTPKIVRKPNIKFEQIRYDFGEITQGDTVDYKFKFSNEGKSPLVIKNAKATCGCTQPSYPFMPIEPGETGFIGVKYVSVGKEGAQKPLITVTTNASKEPIALMLNGMVNLPEKAKDKKKVAMAVDSIAQKKDTVK